MYASFPLLLKVALKRSVRGCLCPVLLLYCDFCVLKMYLHGTESTATSMKEIPVHVLLAEEF